MFSTAFGVPQNTKFLDTMVCKNHMSLFQGAQKSAGTDFCANGSKRANTGVVGTVGGPLVPTTPSVPLTQLFAKVDFSTAMPSTKKSG